MIKSYLNEQMKLHPSMQPQDAVKLCFQAAFGAEHLLTDLAKVKLYFDNEFAAVDARDGILAEFIADDVCRVNLAVWKKMGLCKEELFQLFVASASAGHKGGEEIFWQYMEEAEKLPWEDGAWEYFVGEYRKSPPRAVHHSAAYRERERPAYRIISGHEYTAVIPRLTRNPVKFAE